MTTEVFPIIDSSDRFANGVVTIDSTTAQKLNGSVLSPVFTAEGGLLSFEVAMLPAAEIPSDEQAKELDEWVRRCRVLEDLVRKLSHEVEYDPTRKLRDEKWVEGSGSVSGYDTHSSTPLGPAEEKVLRQVLLYHELPEHADVEL